MPRGPPREDQWGAQVGRSAASDPQQVALTLQRQFSRTWRRVGRGPLDQIRTLREGTLEEETRVPPGWVALAAEPQNLSVKGGGTALPRLEKTVMPSSFCRA